MSRSIGIPYSPQDDREVAELVRALEAGAGKHGDKKSVSCKTTAYTTNGPEKYEVNSWRFKDWDYKRTDLPTYARGIFTYRSTNGKPAIAIRGYDKFFNTGEVNKTKWENIEQNTEGPYELSVKENGCIVFISGLSDGTLLVCSKHSTGPGADAKLSHAIAAERWVNIHLASVGRTRHELAEELLWRNATAVGELCDDNFEEHILAYDKDHAGIYLHGINLNLPEFVTYPGHLVDNFAEQWGFRKTEYLVKDNIKDVRTFLEAVGETGAWQGKDVEGFVIRCRARDKPQSAWHDWFFKYKFEEPYLMYRQWREVTKAVIGGKLPKYKKHVDITGQYLRYARQQLLANPKLGADFNHNHGIIAMRDGFLRERGLKGSDIIRSEMENNGSGGNTVDGGLILVPVATIGCGKTTIAVALQQLFGWGHVQNDNIEGNKGRPRRFAGLVCADLFSHPVVVADRNNHQRRERKQLLQDVHRELPDVKMVALHWVHEQEGQHRDQYVNKVRAVTQKRVFARGDNHQTIQVETKGEREIAGIMDGFLQRFEPLDPDVDPDDGFDAVIELNVLKSSRENLETIITELHTLYPSLWDDIPTGNDLDAAIDTALQDYKPDLKHDLSFGKNKSKKEERGARQKALAKSPKSAKVNYFCIQVPTKDVHDILDRMFQSQGPYKAKFYRQLQQSRRIRNAFHVTLIHRANSAAYPERWRHFNELLSSVLAEEAESVSNPDETPSLGNCRVELERFVWDDRVMCIVVRLIDAQEKGFETTNAIAHITVGTASQNIKPKESSDLLQAWLDRGSGEESGIGELDIKGKVILEGTVHGMYH